MVTWALSGPERRVAREAQGCGQAQPYSRRPFDFGYAARGAGPRGPDQVTTKRAVPAAWPVRLRVNRSTFALRRSGI